MQITTEPLVATAAILAGGLGTRLRPVVSDRPKVLADVAGRPFLTCLLDQLADAGLQRVVLCTGYRADMVRSMLGDWYGPLSLEYSPEDAPLGTGGALRAALQHLTGNTILVANGDSFCQADLPAFARWHAQQDAAASLLLAHVPDTSRYGRVETDLQGRVTRFAEKGREHSPGWINAGIYLLQREVIECISASGPVSLERDVFPCLLDHGLYAHAAGHRFLDIGTPASYAAAPAFMASLALRRFRNGLVQVR